MSFESAAPAPFRRTPVSRSRWADLPRMEKIEFETGYYVEIEAIPDNGSRLSCRPVKNPRYARLDVKGSRSAEALVEALRFAADELETLLGNG